jgi:hypothetical protein
MRVVMYSDDGALRKVGMDRDRATGLMHRVAADTQTEGLIAILSLESSRKRWGGAFYPGDVVPARMQRLRGPWRTEHPDGIPPGLPDKFRLIEVHIGTRGASYPRTDHNRNGFKLWFSSFDSHLAYIFAHELHHYRKHHLGLHPRQGEKGADRWAAARVCELGMPLEMTAFKPRRRLFRRRRKSQPQPTSEQQQLRWERIRALSPGTSIRLTKSDNRAIPPGIQFSFVRPLRGSYRVLVQGPAGADICVPIDWVEVV